MAIKLTNLEAISKQTTVDKVYTYKDLHLDFSPDGRYDVVSNITINKNDITVDYDEQAIKNSLKNLFSTRPGQRFLFPLYGLDLYQFLFEPITGFNAEMIKDKIVMTIKDFEPRVRVVNCLVVPNEDENEYKITLIVEIIELRRSFPINANLEVKNQSFRFLETSQKTRI
jgi:phage baseplate assembly protein W